jgi:hypothetical protein
MLRARAPFPMELTDEVFVLDGKKIPNPLRSFVLPERIVDNEFSGAFLARAPIKSDPGLRRAVDGDGMDATSCCGPRRRCGSGLSTVGYLFA